MRLKTLKPYQILRLRSETISASIKVSHFHYTRDLIRNKKLYPGISNMSVSSRNFMLFEVMVVHGSPNLSLEKFFEAAAAEYLSE